MNTNDIHVLATQQWLNRAMSLLSESQSMLLSLTKFTEFDAEAAMFSGTLVPSSTSTFLSHIKAEAKIAENIYMSLSKRKKTHTGMCFSLKPYKYT